MYLPAYFTIGYNKNAASPFTGGEAVRNSAFSRPPTLENIQGNGILVTENGLKTEGSPPPDYQCRESLGEMTATFLLIFAKPRDTNGARNRGILCLYVCEAQEASTKRVGFWEERGAGRENDQIFITFLRGRS
jgi:hypothetical protein